MIFLLFFSSPRPDFYGALTLRPLQKRKLGPNEKSPVQVSLHRAGSKPVQFTADQSSSAAASYTLAAPALLPSPTAVAAARNRARDCLISS